MTATALYVDDAKFDRMLFTKYFRAMCRDDLTLRCAESVEAGLDLMRAQMPDLLFLDNRVPPYTCFEESLAMFRQAGFRGPVVLLTGLTTSELQAEVERAGQVLGVLDKHQLDSQRLSEVITPLLPWPEDA